MGITRLDSGLWQHDRCKRKYLTLDDLEGCPDLNGEEAEAVAAQAAQMAADAMAAADKAEATGQNARQMVLNRDPRLSTLEGVAATVTQLNAESVADRQQLNSRTAALESSVAAEVARAKAAETALGARLSALESKTVTHQHMIQVLPLLAIGQSPSYTLTWPKALPNSAYSLVVVAQPPTAGLTLGTSKIEVTAKTVTTVTVKVTVTGLALSAGWVLHVTAVSYA